jgi:hypothetical protein
MRGTEGRSGWRGSGGATGGSGADATHFGGWRLSGDILDAPEKLVVPSGNPAGLIVVPDQAVLPNLPALDQVMKMIDIADVLLGHLSSSG